MYDIARLIQQQALAAAAPYLKHAPSALHPLFWLATVEGLIGANFLLLIYFGEGLKHRALRGLWLLTSTPVALSLVPLAIGDITKACCVQIAGAFFAMTLFAVQYGFMSDPAPQPRSPWSYFLAGLLDTFLPFEEGGGAAVRAAGGAQSSAARGPTPASDPKAAEGVGTDTDAHASAHADSDPSGSGRKGPLAGGTVAAATAAAAERQRQRRRAQLERQPLAAPGASYPAAVARLLLELVVQYLIYDAVLTLVVKPLAVFDAAGGGGPPLLSAASVAASVGFTVVLYLHFTLSYRGILVMLSVVKPELLWRCRHQFREPWLAATSSVGELWQRWHQLFRMTFVRLAYRPTRALVRRLILAVATDGGGGGSGAGRTRSSGSTSSSGGKMGPDGGGSKGEGKGGKHQAHAQADARSSIAAVNGAAPNGVAAATSSAAAITAAPPSKFARRLEEASGLLAVFALSGTIHEYMCWAAFGGAGGWQLSFFLLHAAAVLLEQALGLPLAPESDYAAIAAAAAAAEAAQAVAAGSGGGGAGADAAKAARGKWRRRRAALARAAVRVVHGACVLAFNFLTSVLFMRPWLQGNYHNEFWHPVSPVGWAMRRLREALGVAAGAGWAAGGADVGSEL